MKKTIVLILMMVTIFSSVNGEKPNRKSSKAPIGTIVAWAGVPSLLPSNWKICDGTQIPQEKYPKLCLILADNWGPITGAKNNLYTLPNLQGMFLRGVNQGKSGQLSDSDASNRVSIKAEKLSADKSNQVGSYQFYATAKPKNDFNISKSGEHEHTQKVRRNDSANCGAGGSQCARGAGVTTESTTGGGKHSHVIAEGGDKETRPVNAYVYWIIKVK